MSIIASQEPSSCGLTMPDQNCCELGKINASIGRIESLLGKGEDLLYSNADDTLNVVKNDTKKVVVTNVVFEPPKKTRQPYVIAKRNLLGLQKSLDAFGRRSITQKTLSSVFEFPPSQPTAAASNPARRTMRREFKGVKRDDDVEDISIVELRERIRRELEDYRSKGQVIRKMVPRAMKSLPSAERPRARHTVRNASEPERLKAGIRSSHCWKPQPLNGMASYPHEYNHISLRKTYPACVRNPNRSPNKTSLPNNSTCVSRGALLSMGSVASQLKGEKMVTQKQREVHLLFKTNMYRGCSSRRLFSVRPQSSSVPWRSVFWDVDNLNRLKRARTSPMVPNKIKNNKRDPVARISCCAPDAVASRQKSRPCAPQVPTLEEVKRGGKSKGGNPSHPTSKEAAPQSVKHSCANKCIENEKLSIRPAVNRKVEEKRKTDVVSDTEIRSVAHACPDSATPSSTSRDSSVVWCIDESIHPLVKPLDLRALRK